MRPLVLFLSSVLISISATAQTKRAVEPTPKPVLPAPLPQLPPPLAEQALPYPGEYIDRPYTLPEGLHEFSLRGSAATLSSDAGDFVFPLYLTEVEYRQPLTNDFSLVWNPLPLGIQHQPKRSDTTITGVSWSVGWQYQGNFGLLPQFSSFLRYKLAKKSAVEMELSYWTFIPFEKAGSVWTGSFRIGPLFQQSSRFALSPRIHFVIDNIRLDQLYHETRTPIENQLLTAERAQFHLPFSLWTSWTIRPKFDVTAEYTLIGAGLGGGNYAQLFTLGTNLRW